MWLQLLLLEPSPELTMRRWQWRRQTWSALAWAPWRPRCRRCCWRVVGRGCCCCWARSRLRRTRRCRSCRWAWCWRPVRRRVRPAAGAVWRWPTRTRQPRPSGCAWAAVALPGRHAWRTSRASSWPPRSPALYRAAPASSATIHCVAAAAILLLRSALRC